MPGTRRILSVSEVEQRYAEERAAATAKRRAQKAADEEYAATGYLCDL